MPTNQDSILTLIISVIGLSLALFEVPGILMLRTCAVVLSLGAGQVHLAVGCLIVLLIAGSGNKIFTETPKAPTLICILTWANIFFVSTFSEITDRFFSEIFQLAVYFVVFLLGIIYLRVPGRLNIFMRSLAHSSTIIALIGLGQMVFGVSYPPHIYVGRGGNEGSFFLLLMGIVPCFSLYFIERKIIYLIEIAIITAAQFFAQSRANVLIVILLVFLSIAMINRGFVFKLFILSTAFLLIFNFRDEFVYFVQDFNDYSTSERIKLYEAAFSLWKEAPVVGWGWGSTSEVVPKIYTIGNEYPHFHSTYAQLIVELGFLGIIIIIIFLSACLMNIKDGLKKIRTGVPIGVYQIFISLAIFGSGFSEAIVFGADRAIPLMLSLAIMHKIAFNWKH